MGGARSDGVSVPVPEKFSDFRDNETELMLNALTLTDVTDVRYSGPAAAAWVEIAAALILRTEHIEPRLQARTLVIQESFSFKHAVKWLLIAQEAAPNTKLCTAVPTLIDSLITIFGSAPFQPDVGVFVKCEPRRACSWGMQNAGRFGILEDLTLAGRKGEAGFLALQEACDKVFEQAATEWGWHTLRVDDRSLHDAVQAGLVQLLAIPALRDWIARSKAELRHPNT
jgi:hypothetical protein